MAAYYINSEETEDTFDFTDNLQDAMRIAREVAQKGQAGDLIYIEHEGQSIWQFVLLPNGSVAEKKIGGFG
jgi:hypothetical protein